MKVSVPQRSVDCGERRGWGGEKVVPGLGTDYKVWGAPPSTPAAGWQGEGL